MTIHRLVPSQRHGFVALLILVSIIRSTSFLQPRPSTFCAVSLFRTLLIGPNDYGRCRSTNLHLSNPNFDEKQQPRNINSLSASQKERRERMYDAKHVFKKALRRQVLPAPYQVHVTLQSTLPKRNVNIYNHSVLVMMTV